MKVSESAAFHEVPSQVDFEIHHFEARVVKIRRIDSIMDCHNRGPVVWLHTTAIVVRLRVNGLESSGRSWERYVDAVDTYLIWARRFAFKYRGDFETRR